MRNSIFKVVLAWLVTIYFLPLFALMLLTFHVIHYVASLISLAALERAIMWLNKTSLCLLRLVGTRITLLNEHPLPSDRPLIVVSNHQSLFDVPLLTVLFQKHNPKFIAKKELTRWIPAVSFDLRNGCYAVIDRSDRSGAVTEIQRFAKVASERNLAVCIFPEGTRARDGVLKPFKSAGFMTLAQALPNALIVPVALHGSWEITYNKLFPVGVGARIVVRTLPPRPAAGVGKDVVEEIRQEIEQANAPERDAPASP
jgi:1-acyl-sn-glycerol-3-phosphate acyltransferase